MDQKTIQCPVCKGNGHLKKPGLKIEARIRRRKDIAHKLRSEGYTIREIMALMGYKSTNSVAVLLK
jgi:hypothetical protein